MLPLSDDVRLKTFPFVTLFFITANIAVFIYQMSLTPEQNRELLLLAGVIPENIFSRRNAADMLSLLSSLFMHAGIAHLAGNMLFLAIFARSVEDRLGHFSFSVFYLVCGAAATLAHVWHNPASSAPLIGASGAISGVLGAYLLFFPRARVKVLLVLFVFITTVKVPAVIFIGAWALLQFINISRGHPQIAWYAHIGGFMTGFVITGIGLASRRKYE